MHHHADKKIIDDEYRIGQNGSVIDVQVFFVSNYRRSDARGASFFFTVVTYHRRPVFDSDVSIAILRDSIRDEMQRRPFVIEAAVILPDHIHCLWQLPENDSDFSSRWREIKKDVTKRLGASKNARGEGNVWQRRFWEHQIRNERDWRMHMDYIHYNPVKHGYVNAPFQWRWSSFMRWVEKGAYELDWGTIEPSDISALDFE